MQKRERAMQNFLSTTNEPTFVGILGMQEEGRILKI
jgi:hypothetical protein